MATKTKITAEFSVDDKASKPVGKISGAFGSLKSKVTAFLNPWTLAIAGFTALAAGAVKVIAGLADLETKMVNVGNLTGASREEVDKMTSDLIALSQEIPSSVGDLSVALFDVVSAGVAAADSIDFLGVASKLAAAGVTDTQTSVDGLTTVMNAWGKTAADATAISDVFFAAQQKGKTTIAELSSSIGDVAPIAAALGVSFEETAAAMATLTTRGISTSQSATGLKAAFSNLVKPSEMARDLAAELGIEFNAQAVEAKGLTGVLKDVRDATGGDVDQLARLFGSVEAVNAVLALSNDEFVALDANLKATENASGATEKAFEEMQNTFSVQVALMKNNFFALGAALLGAVLPKITMMISGFNKFFNFVSDGVKKIKGDYVKTASELETENGKLNEKLKKLEDAKFSFFAEKRKEALEAQIATNQQLIDELAAKAEKEVAIADDSAAKAIERMGQELEAQRMADEQALAQNAEKNRVLAEQNEAAYQADADFFQNTQALKLQAEKDAAAESERLMRGDADFAQNIMALKLQAEKDAAAESERLRKEVAEQNEEAYQADADFFARAQELKREAENKTADSLLSAAKRAAAGERDVLKATKKYGKELLKDQVGAFIAARQAEMAAFAAANFWNPAGWAAGAGIVGLEVVKNEAFAAIDRFQDGGIVGGSAIVGDTQVVRVNSGEVILNQQQQKTVAAGLMGFANSSGTSGGQGAIERKLDQLIAIMSAPGEIRLNGDSFAKATYQRQKRMLRTGQLSGKG